MTLDGSRAPKQMSVQTERLLDLVDRDFFNSDCEQNALLYDDGDSVQYRISYAQLFNLSEQLSCLLEELKAEKHVVAIAAETQFLIPLIILGISKANGIFMYLDRDLPEIKRNELLKSTKSDFIIWEGSFTINSDWKIVKKIQVLDRQLIILQSKQDSNETKEMEDLALIMFTSGSTGTPKIVRIPHSCIIPNIVDLRERLAVTKDDTVFVASPFTFDPSIVDVFLALSRGASLLLVPPKLKSMPQHLAKVLNRHSVTLIQATPSFFLQFTPEMSQTLLLSPSSMLRIFLLGGEPFPPLSALRSRRHSRNQTKFYNIYGITEVSSWASISPVHLTSQDFQVTLGEPMRNTELRVVDASNNILTEGAGQLFIGGSRYCLLDSETVESLTFPVFRPTGDLVELRNNQLFYIGRLDDTIKRMGQRLSLGALEHIALESGSVERACALLDHRESLVLVCSVDMASNREQNCRNLREYFKGHASNLENPDEIVVLEHLPLSKHGKIDRRRIRELIKNRSQSVDRENWPTHLKSLWKKLTGTSEDPTSQSQFILNGGNSLTALRFSNLAEEGLGCRLPELPDLLLNRQWNDIYQYVRESLTNPAPLDSNSVSFDEPNLLERPRKLEIDLVFRWKYNMDKCVDATPLVIEDGVNAVFIGSHSHLFCAIDLKTGEELWRRQLADRIESSAATDANKSRIFVGCYDGCLYCLESSSGRIKWSHPTGNQIKCTPTCYLDRVYCGSHDRHLYCFDLDGRLLWKSQFSQGSVFSRPAFSIKFDLIAAASLDGTCCALRSESGEICWTFKCPKPIFGGLVSFDDMLLVPSVDGCLYCLNLSDGNLCWTFKSAGPIFSTPRIARNEKILFGCHDHFVYCIDTSGSELWRFDCGSPVYSSPLALEDADRSLVVVCSTKSRVWILDLNDGQPIGRTELTGEVFSSPVIASRDHIVFGCRDDFVYCYQIVQ